MAKEKILVVEDEKDIVELLQYNLEKENFKIQSANNGQRALDLVRKNHPDLILLDLMLPEIDGLEVCRILKKDTKTSHIPIIMLTAKSSESDKIVGLELGADDYITKPFSMKELIARIKALLRRMNPEAKQAEMIRIGDVAIDFSKYLVTQKGKPVELTTKEFELLKALINAHSRVISRDKLLENVWGYDYSLEITTRTVDVHILYLRKKLKSIADRIITIKNVGYRLELES
ncbi:MAG: response regulator transcription factor [Candidatus Methylomirabilota bacterium]|nr:response regulator transcription factor [bacterium]